MANLPDLRKDQTLEDINKKLEEKQQLEAPRHYLGMSQIGHECWRNLYYSFRNVEKRIIPAKNIKAIQDGYAQEEIMIERLRMLPYIKLFTENPKYPDEQIGYSLLLDHFRGHVDGIIKGIKSSPATWHIWENKAVNEQKFKKLIKLMDEVGEKKALLQWDEIYYAQAQIYMHCAKLTRHYLNVQSPGGRDCISCRTEYKKKHAEYIIEKAKVIIFEKNIPAKLSENREFYKCKWCDYQGICHDNKIPLVHCKTCIHSEIVKDGKRNCLKKDKIIQDELLHVETCGEHLYNPALIPAKLVERQEDCCIYIIEESKIKFANCIKSSIPELKNELDGIYTSLELLNKIKNINNLKKETLNIQSEFDGDFVNSKKESLKAWDKQYESGLQL